MADHDILPAEHINVLAWALTRNKDINPEQAGEWLAALNARDNGGDAAGYRWAEPRSMAWSDGDIMLAVNAYVNRTPSILRTQEDDRLDELAYTIATMPREYHRDSGIPRYRQDRELVIQSDSDPERLARGRFLDNLCDNLLGEARRLDPDAAERIRTDDRFAHAADPVDRLRFAAEAYGRTLDRAMNAMYVDWGLDDDDPKSMDRFAPLILEAYGLGPRVEDATDTERSRISGMLQERVGDVDAWNVDRPLERAKRQWTRDNPFDRQWWGYIVIDTDGIRDERFYRGLNQAIRGVFDRHGATPPKDGLSGPFHLSEKSRFMDYADALGGLIDKRHPDHISEMLRNAYDCAPAGKDRDPGFYPSDEVKAVRDLIRTDLDPVAGHDMSGMLRGVHADWMASSDDLLADPERYYEHEYEEEYEENEEYGVDDWTVAGLVWKWGETMDDVMRSDDPSRIADRILEANGVTPVGHVALGARVLEYIDPTFRRLDGDLPAGSGTFARLAIEDHLEGAEHAPAEPRPDMTNGAGAYPDPADADPYANPADQAPDPTAAGVQQHVPTPVGPSLG
ncbi:hypothetical protein CSQ85_08910 [Bifidobacterium rousetti]|uniref:hypothetical protein n=1 Tax=Bifidobacterium rousetti TaxID=2045439 RepID=UPI00123B5032|nr:hypothetical protein [Bifidobacterium rousetti]KAA8818270.1 hypothetical protein CSQ85_08910 [Bifidobacterium rousetti]